MDAQHQHGEKADEKDPDGATPGGRLPDLGLVGLFRWAWRQLTSMRTALFLLLLVAVAAVPGSVFPQRSLDPTRVADYLREHPDSGPWLDRLGFFEVFSSPWFSAIYLLLMISLVGCVVPRTRVHLHAIRQPPPRAPRRLERLPSHCEGVVDGEPEAVLAQARRALGWRYRFRCSRDDDPNTLSAETGYSRETGNLLFHISLLTLIVALAWGHLVGWRGDRIVPVGQSFSNSVSGYDTFNPGPWVDVEDLHPFTVRIDSLDVRFESDPRAGRQVGAPRDFRARTSVSEGPGQSLQQRELSVNGPLGFGGTQVYLLGNGYAPTITVRDGSGQVLFRQQVPFLPQDDNYTSTGAVKVTGAQPKQLGLMGLLLPTAGVDTDGGLRSTFPGATNPALVLTAYEGELFPEGRAQSVYTVDTSRMAPVTGADGAPVRLTLTPGQSAELPGGRGSVTFDQLDRWAGVSARYDPARPLALASALVAALGLVASLLVRRRRIFVRVHTEPVGSDGRRRTRMEVAGLAKGDDPNLDAVVADLLRRVTERQVAERRNEQGLSVGSGR
ncbi:cytochrome c biogenesis protein [Austwickia chelonae]|uniref:Cytochrome c biogenesis protein ResB n=1 Tax=Austwickia chelonae NBRC 105200 TaxID=1184607 RepID=K6W4Y7_9MICO|nr:cytochrome c biogenesis protein ResB [Austwickia chelonae]GAB76892.1 cytochrome c biogenesis protein ResB [Austwickia chelonae NBRC 105200]SEW32047.1 cytochrome c biogenesis protein [Austwickia chelonae]